MSAALRIAVLHFERRFVPENSYLIEHLADCWREQGHDVRAVAGIAGPLPKADIAFQHVDITVVPDAYLKALRPFPVVVNRRVADISKRLFSAQLLRPGEDYSGPVIVKTNANYGGRIESGLSGRGRGRGRAPMSWAWRRSMKEYALFPSVRDVPDEVWSNGHLVVEKFLPERTGPGQYCLRVWMFLGDREIHYRNIATGPIVKSSNTVGREDLAPEQVPDLLRRVRRLLGFDYGKFDYTLHEGQAVLFDVNRTPGMPAGYIATAESRARVLHLSRGITSVVERDGDDARA